MASKSVRGKGEGSVYKRASDGRWAGTLELPALADGKRRRKVVTGRTKQDALARLEDQKRQLGLHGDLPTSSKSATIWFRYWLDEVAKGEVRANTWQSYDSMYRQHVEPTLGKVPLDKITVAHVRKVIAKLSDRPSRAQHVYRLIYGALKAAEQEGQIMKNPAAKMKPPTVPEPELEALTVEELLQVIKSITEPGSEDPLAILWLTYIFTGMRRGEALGLRWEDVGESIDVSWQLQRIPAHATIPTSQEAHHVRGTLWRTRPKSKRGRRVIPLVEPLKSILEQHREATGGTGYVFTTDGDVIDADRISKAWPLVLARSGVKKRKVRLHDIRHSTVDLLYAAGVPEVTIKEIVGHSGVAMTRRYKSRGNRAELESAMEKVSALLSVTE